jgi:dCTP deaminase
MIESADSLKDLMFTKRESTREQLIISPILNWKEQVKRGSASVDLRLSCSFTIPKRSQLTNFDPLLESKYKRKSVKAVNGNGRKPRSRQNDLYVGIGDYLVLHPRQFVLGNTLEWIHLPCNYAAYVVGRSSWGREGLVIATATGVHPGYSGVLTLELTNLGEIPLKLYPGITIAQLFIHKVNTREKGVWDRSVFLGSTKAESGNPISDEDFFKIDNFKEREE